jgi:hypothetical protein
MSDQMKVERFSFTYIFPFFRPGRVIRAVKKHIEDTPFKVVGPYDEFFAPYVVLKDGSSIVTPDFGNTRSECPVTISTLECLRDATMAFRFHLNSSGACSFVIKLSIAHVADISIEQLLSLSNSAEPPVLHFSFNDMEIDPSQFTGVFQKDSQTLHELFDYFLHAFSQVSKHAYLKGKSEFGREDVPTLRAIDEVVQQQMPYVITKIEFFDREEYCRWRGFSKNAACENGKPLDEDYSPKKLLALLYRFKVPSEWSKVDLSHCDFVTGCKQGQLANFHLHEDLFLFSHLRSAVVLINCGTKSQVDNNFICSFERNVEGLFAEIIARWFSYLLLNRFVEEDIFELNLEDTEKPASVLTKLIAARKTLAEIFDSTVAYKNTSGTFAHLYRVVSEIFDVPTLRNQALERCNLLENIYRHYRESLLFSRQVRFSANIGQENED